MKPTEKVRAAHKKRIAERKAKAQRKANRDFARGVMGSSKASKMGRNAKKGIVGLADGMRDK